MDDLLKLHVNRIKSPTKIEGALNTPISVRNEVIRKLAHDRVQTIRSLRKQRTEGGQHPLIKGIDAAELMLLKEICNKQVDAEIIIFMGEKNIYEI